MVEEAAGTNQQKVGQKIASQSAAGAIAAWVTMTWVPPESQAIAGPTILVVLSSVGKFVQCFRFDTSKLFSMINHPPDALAL